MVIVAVIPARMNSSRFPGKPMASIYGMPMIGHCFNRAKLCKKLNHVYVATCDQVIYDYIQSINGNVVMTSNSHERACDRAAEAMLKIEQIHNKKIDILVMLQGDEPMVTPNSIESAIAPLITNLDTKIFKSLLNFNISFTLTNFDFLIINLCFSFCGDRTIII